MHVYTSNAERFLKYVGVELFFEAQDDVADLVQISGFSDPYKATFVRSVPPARQRKVIVFLDNARKPPTTSLHILSALSHILDEMEGVSCFSEWCASLRSHPTSYDACQLEARRRFLSILSASAGKMGGAAIRVCGTAAITSLISRQSDSRTAPVSPTGWG
jgi:hypothetical protein